MSSNLASRLSASTCITRKEVVDELAELLEGRSIGRAYIVGVRRKGANEILIETDDGCHFLLSCEES